MKVRSNDELNKELYREPTEFVITPSAAPTTDYQVANKKYVDDNSVSLATVNSYDIGVNQTWQDVTASRSAGVTYTNTTGKPIEINILYVIQNNESAILLLNGVEIDKAINSGTGGTIYSKLSLVVPSGYTYTTNTVGGVIYKWSELR